MEFSIDYFFPNSVDDVLILLNIFPRKSPFRNYANTGISPK